MRALLLILLTLPLVASAAGCPTAGDGVCDEPALCPLGSDADDCDAACEGGEAPPHLYGACQYRARGGLPDHAAVDPDLEARGTFGSGGRYGLWFDTLESVGPDGERPSRRYFSVYVPDSYQPGKPAPVLFYGGGFGDDMHQAAYTDLNRFAEVNGVIIAYVQQDYRDFGPRGYRHAWYVYLNAFAGGWEVVPDLDFYLQVVDRLKADYNVDRTRIFVSGTSRGAGMSIMLAFLAPSVFAGFSSQAGFGKVNDFVSYIAEYQGRQMPSVLYAGGRDTNVTPDESADVAALMEEMGWGDRLMYLPIQEAGHQWQPQLTQIWWDFLVSHPLPLEEAAP